MRKYLLSIILILCGLILLYLNYSNKNNPTYSETLFAKEAEKFDLVFDRFTTEVKDGITKVINEYQDTLKIKDSLQTRKYFLDQIKSYPALNSIGYFQGDFKLVAERENNSYVYAVDSSAVFEVVKWDRFENGKRVSSWFESLAVPIYQSKWYQDLMSNPEELKWYLRRRVKTVNSSDDDKEYFYVGYSYFLQGLKSAVVLEFERDKIFAEYNITSKEINPRISFMNLDGQELHLNTEHLKKETDSLIQEEKVDSIQHYIAKHFENFKEIPKGTFKFSYDNQVYWNSFKRLTEERGIQFYLYTIPNSQLIAKSTPIFSDYSTYVAGALIFLGLLLLFIRKRFFYRPNRMKIPTVNEILRQDEDRYLEFKSSLRWDYRQEKTNPELEKVIMKTIAAFGNTDGGILLIGVDDDKNILGLEKDFQTLKKSDADYYEVHLRNIMHKLMGVKYVSKYIRTQFELMEGNKMVCKIKVIPANEPLYLQYKNKNGQLEEKFYVRSGNSSHEIKSIAEINDYINSKFN